MLWPAWLWIGTPVKFSVWLMNRLATWTGVGYVWKRFRTQRHVWVWLILLNVVSMAGLALALRWLYYQHVN